MRRLPSLLLVSTLALAACGSDSDDAATDEQTEQPPGDDSADEPADEPAEQPADEPTDEPVDEPASEKPEVDVPGEAPDELLVTVIIDGEGEGAEVGDTVIVDYVGVRSLDGVEFDNSYDRGQPFAVVLGSGSVIQGWEEGLEGARTGDRLQLDIPSDLAYGEAARSDVIRENEPLTFVVDVRTVVKSPDPSEAPTEPGVELSTGDGVEETEFVDLVEGDGPTLAEGQTAILHFVYYRGDNGVPLESSWGGDPLTVVYDSTQLLPGLASGLEGMQVGGRRAITIPPEDGFGPEGNPQGGLPADTDVIFVVDLIAAY